MLAECQGMRPCRFSSLLGFEGSVYYSVTLLDGRVVFTEAELVRWNLLVHVSVLMEGFEEESFKNFGQDG